jgi:hypothetical protein
VDNIEPATLRAMSMCMGCDDGVCAFGTVRCRYALLGGDEDAESPEAAAASVSGPLLLRGVLDLALVRCGGRASLLLVDGEDKGTFEVDVLRVPHVKQALATSLFEAPLAVQVAALVEVQVFYSVVGCASKLAEAAMMTLYDLDVLPEPAFRAWNEQANEQPGRAECVAELAEWMAWLEDNDDDDDDDEDEDEDEDEEEEDEEEDDDDEEEEEEEETE